MYRKLFRKIITASVSVIIFSGLLVVFCNFYIIRSTQKSIYSDVSSIPQKNVGLVLGCSKYATGGGPNLFFKYRMDATAELYHAGKIRHIIVSGDNHTKSYDEATAMRSALMERGVPPAAITCDYAGFRTLDSVVRCKKVFGQQNVTIISQKFHVERALFIARQYNMNAVGFTADDVSYRSSAKTKYREYLAKCKAMLDIFVLNKKPKFLGEPVKIQF